MAAFVPVGLAPSTNHPRRTHAVRNVIRTPKPCLYKRNNVPPKPFQWSPPKNHQHILQQRQLTSRPKMTSTTDQVIHEEALQQYTLTLPGVQEPAFLKYVVREHPTDESAKVYDLTHTYVTPAMRGHGVAARLVSFAVEHARQNGHKVIPSCSYIGTYMKRYPKQKDVLLE